MDRVAPYLGLSCANLMPLPRANRMPLPQEGDPSRKPTEILLFPLPPPSDRRRGRKDSCCFLKNPRNSHPDTPHYDPGGELFARTPRILNPAKSGDIEKLVLLKPGRPSRSMEIG
ncbi:hypothetical protein H8959_019343 [Pygathrix nigripes]